MIFLGQSYHFLKNDKIRPVYRRYRMDIRYRTYSAGANMKNPGPKGGKSTDSGENWQENRYSTCQVFAKVLIG